MANSVRQSRGLFIFGFAEFLPKFAAAGQPGFHPPADSVANVHNARF